MAGQLCRQFAQLGAAAVWCAGDADRPPAGDIEAVQLACVNPTERLTGLPIPIPGVSGIRRLAREVRLSDAVVIHDALYVTSILAMLIAKATGKRAILIQHIGAIPFASPFLRSAMRAANAIITQPMLRAADVRVFISDTVRDDLLKRDHGQSAELLFNGVDGTIFHPFPIGTDRSPGARRVLFVGRFVEKKGLKVLHALAAIRPDLDFFLVGRGPIRPSEWGLTNVHDLGPLNQEELADLYRWADVLVLPSVGEGYPLVIQEAMACGLPVVCGSPCDRADPDAARWLKGVRIDLAEPDASAKGCSEAIDQLGPSPEERAAMAKYALQRYDWRKTAKRLIALAEQSSGGGRVEEVDPTAH